MEFKYKKLAFILGIGALVLAVVLFSYRQTVSKPELKPAESPAEPQNDPPQIISTKPEPLEEAIVSTNEIIEVTFNRPLENVGEFKVRLETKKDFKVELSPDRKTAKIIPFKPYELGTTYTLFIGPDTKFDGVGAWGQEKIFHFRTIKYTGV